MKTALALMLVFGLTGTLRAQTDEANCGLKWSSLVSSTSDLYAQIYPTDPARYSQLHEDVVSWEDVASAISLGKKDIEEWACADAMLASVVTIASKFETQAAEIKEKERSEFRTKVEAQIKSEAAYE